MSYIVWNDALYKHFFNENQKGKEVVLTVNEELITQIGLENNLGDFSNFKITINELPNYRNLFFANPNGLFVPIHQRIQFNRTRNAFQLIDFILNLNNNQNVNPYPYFGLICYFLYIQSVNDNGNYNATFSQQTNIPTAQINNLLAKAFSHLKQIQKRTDFNTGKFVIRNLYGARNNGPHRYTGILKYNAVLNEKELKALDFLLTQTNLSNEASWEIIKLRLIEENNAYYHNVYQTLGNKLNNLQLRHPIETLIRSRIDHPQSLLINPFPNEVGGIGVLEKNLELLYSNDKIEFVLHLFDGSHIPESDIFVSDIYPGLEFNFRSFGPRYFLQKTSGEPIYIENLAQNLEFNNDKMKVKFRSRNFCFMTNEGGSTYLNNEQYIKGRFYAICDTLRRDLLQQNNPAVVIIQENFHADFHFIQSQFANLDTSCWGQNLEISRPFFTLRGGIKIRFGDPVQYSYTAPPDIFITNNNANCNLKIRDVNDVETHLTIDTAGKSSIPQLEKGDYSIELYLGDELIKQKEISFVDTPTPRSFSGFKINFSGLPDENGQLDGIKLLAIDNQINDNRHQIFDSMVKLDEKDLMCFNKENSFWERICAKAAISKGKVSKEFFETALTEFYQENPQLIKTKYSLTNARKNLEAAGFVSKDADKFIIHKPHFNRSFKHRFDNEENINIDFYYYTGYRDQNCIREIRNLTNNINYQKATADFPLPDIIFSINDLNNLTQSFLQALALDNIYITESKGAGYTLLNKISAPDITFETRQEVYIDTINGSINALPVPEDARHKLLKKEIMQGNIRTGVDFFIEITCDREKKWYRIERNKVEWVRYYIYKENQLPFLFELEMPGKWDLFIPVFLPLPSILSKALMLIEEAAPTVVKMDEYLLEGGNYVLEFLPQHMRLFYKFSNIPQTQREILANKVGTTPVKLIKKS